MLIMSSKFDLLLIPIFLTLLSRKHVDE